ncbi:hypothetical protein CAP35_13495 [Chitinophagaceae bacterium IBVUCB1]|nr:hypothetical protein CAP35_13495 [Chitinophagaceae bacterium IBVUCB1]
MKKSKQGRILLHLNIIAVLVCISFFAYIHAYIGSKESAVYFAVAALAYCSNLYLLQKKKVNTVAVMSVVYSDLLVLLFDSGFVNNYNNSVVLYIPLLLFGYVVTKYEDKWLRTFTVSFTFACLLVINFTDLTPKLGKAFQEDEATAIAMQIFNIVIAIICSLLLVRTIARHNYYMEHALADAKETAEQSLQEKNRFLSIMSHEIRTPANAILGMTHLLKEKGVPDTILRDVQLLHYSSQHLKSLIDNVLYYNNLEMGKVEAEMRPFDIRKLCHNAIDSFVLEAAKKNIELHFDFDDRIPQFVLGDYEKLILVLHNLLSNAIKFTKKGEVFLWVKMNHMDAANCFVLFKVADTGVGIEQEQLTGIFNVFNQLDSKITRSHDGMGLGLSISQKLLQLMQSNLRVNSEEGIGTTFYFEVGLGTTNEVKDDEQRFIETHGLSTIKVLLVEDNKLNILVAKKILENMQAIVTVAKNGQEAVNLLAANSYDVVLMDLHMPVMDGFEATKYIRQTDTSTPIIAFTADAYEEARQKAKDAGMNDFITKPFDPVLLYNKIITNLAP